MPNAEWVDTKLVPSDQWTYLQDLVHKATYTVKMVAYTKQGHKIPIVREVTAGNRGRSC